jgi:hypothetical protein
MRNTVRPNVYCNIIGKINVDFIILHISLLFVFKMKIYSFYIVKFRNIFITDKYEYKLLKISKNLFVLLIC